MNPELLELLKKAKLAMQKITTDQLETEVPEVTPYFEATLSALDQASRGETVDREDLYSCFAHHRTGIDLEVERDYLQAH